MKNNLLRLYALILTALTFNWLFFPFALMAILLHHYVVHIQWAHKKWKWWSIIGLLASPGSPMEYALVHRQHHKYSDNLGDPHSPKLQGFWKSFFLNIDDVKLETILIKDYLTTFHKFLHRWYVEIMFLFFTLCFYIEIPLYFILTYATFSAMMITSFCHMHGEPRNVWWMFFINPLEYRHGSHHGN